MGAWHCPPCFHQAPMAAWAKGSVWSCPTLTRRMLLLSQTWWYSKHFCCSQLSHSLCVWQRYAFLHKTAEKGSRGGVLPRVLCKKPWSIDNRFVPWQMMWLCTPHRQTRCRSELWPFTALSPAQLLLISNVYHTKGHPPTGTEPAAIKVMSSHLCSCRDNLVMWRHWPFSSPKMCCFAKLIHAVIMQSHLLSGLPKAAFWLGSLLTGNHVATRLPWEDWAF